MIEKYVQALADGKIISVSWGAIQENLGEDDERQHKCAICLNGDDFPPKPLEVHSLSEKDISAILEQSNVQWMAETYEGQPLVSPIEARYFISATPKAGPWMKNPNK